MSSSGTYRCKEDRNAKPEASDVLLMVEVSSPSTEREDLIDEMAQYAAAEIPAYLVVRMSADGDIIDAREFHLDAATFQYRVESLILPFNQSGLPWAPQIAMPVRAVVPERLMVPASPGSTGKIGAMGRFQGSIAPRASP
jgi:Putative restriction endonuclease